ncbi:MAG: OsmC family protein [Candidatus Thermoplasmatota archaeon]
MSKAKMTTFEAETEKKQGFECEVNIRNFSITIDEPEQLGGCPDFTGSIVAQQMGYELNEFEMHVSGDLDPRGVRGKADVFPGFQDIRVKIKSIEGVPKEKLPDFVEKIEKRCPVSDTLRRNLEVKIER